MNFKCHHQLIEKITFKIFLLIKVFEDNQTTPTLLKMLN